MRFHGHSLSTTAVAALATCLAMSQAMYAGVPVQQNLRLRQGESLSVTGTLPTPTILASVPGTSSTASITSLMSGSLNAGLTPTLAAPIISPTEVTVEAGFMLNIRNHFPHDIYVYFKALAPGLDNRQAILKPPMPGSTTGDPILWCPGINSTTPDFSLTIPKNGSNQMMLPMNITSGRVYLSQEKLPFPINQNAITFADPTTANVDRPEQNMTWGFIELSHKPPPKDSIAGRGPTPDGGEVGIWANLSFVDFVGMMLGISVKPKDGPPQIVKGMMPDAVPKICKGLEEHSKKYSDKPEHSWWKKLCIYKDDQPLRVMSPNLYRDMTKSWQEGAPKELLDYYDPYVAEVWNTYSSSPLEINTQLHGNNETEVGNLCLCTTSEDPRMACQCGETERWNLTRPTSTDIFSCNSGTFNPDNDNVLSYRQLRARLCAGFVRSTLLMDKMSPSTEVMPERYYPEGNITDYYSKIVHENLYESMGYTFSFDDVDPKGHNSAGLIKIPHVKSMNIVAGGWHEHDELELGEEDSSTGASSASTSSSNATSMSSAVSASVSSASTSTTSSIVSTSSSATAS